MEPIVLASVITGGVTITVALMGLFGSIIIMKLNKIHTLANSNLASANARLDDALARITVLQEVVTEMRSAIISKPKTS